MQIIKKYDKYSQYLFFAAMLIHIVVMCVGFSMWEIPFRGRLLQLAFVLCAVKILMTYYDLVEWGVMWFLGILAIVSYAFTREKYTLYVVVLIFAAKSVDMNRIMRVLLCVCVLSMIVVPLLAIAGVGGTVSETRDFGREVVETRYQLGFSHANNIHGTLWYIIALIIYMYKEKLDWKFYFGATVLNVVLYMLTASKAGLGVAQIVLIAGVLFKYADKYIWNKRFIYYLGAIAFVGIIALSLISMKIDCFADYGPVMKKLDSVTTGRLNIAYQSAYIGEIKLIGTGGTHIFPIDNGFVSLAADYGWIIWGVYIGFTFFMIYISGKKNDGILFAIIMTCIIYTFMEETYVLNDAYILGNLSYIVAMVLLGEKKPAVAKEDI